MPIINGHEIYVELYGHADKRTVILLHHGLGSVASWNHQLPALLANEFRVIAYDRWGYGHSAVRDSLSMPYFEEDLEDLKSLLDLYDVESAALVGHSDGGTIALYYAAQNPTHVSCLITVAAHIYIEKKMETGIEHIRKMYEEEPHFHTGLKRMHGMKVDRVFYGWYLGWCRAENRTWDARRLLDGIICPTLIMQGLEDEHATSQHAQDIVECIPYAELRLIPAANHMLPQENADDFNRIMIDFLEKCW